MVVHLVVAYSPFFYSDKAVLNQGIKESRAAGVESEPPLRSIYALGVLGFQ